MRGRLHLLLLAILVPSASAEEQRGAAGACATGSLQGPSGADAVTSINSPGATPAGLHLSSNLSATHVSHQAILLLRIIPVITYATRVCYWGALPKEGCEGYRLLLTTALRHYSAFPFLALPPITEGLAATSGIHRVDHPTLDISTHPTAGPVMTDGANSCGVSASNATEGLAPAAAVLVPGLLLAAHAGPGSADGTIRGEGKAHPPSWQTELWRTLLASTTIAAALFAILAAVALRLRCGCMRLRRGKGLRSSPPEAGTQRGPAEEQPAASPLGVVRVPATKGAGGTISRRSSPVPAEAMERAASGPALLEGGVVRAHMRTASLDGPDAPCDSGASAHPDAHSPGTSQSCSAEEASPHGRSRSCDGPCGAEASPSSADELAPGQRRGSAGDVPMLRMPRAASAGLLRLLSQEGGPEIALRSLSSALEASGHVRRSSYYGHPSAHSGHSARSSVESAPLSAGGASLREGTPRAGPPSPLTPARLLRLAREASLTSHRSQDRLSGASAGSSAAAAAQHGRGGPAEPRAEGHSAHSAASVRLRGGALPPEALQAWSDGEPGGSGGQQVPPPPQWGALPGQRASSEGGANTGSGDSWASRRQRLERCNAFASGGAAPHATGALPSEQRPHGVCAKLGPAEVVRAQEARPRFSGVQLGRLIGTGSFGRVYKGEWKGGVVAVKVIAHDASLSRRVDTLRESLVGISMQHPNVMTTYNVLTTIVAGGLAEQPEQARLDSARAKGYSVAQLGPGSAHPLEEELLETWLLLEYCDQGPLDRAIAQGRFRDDLASIYLCLMDIAAGMTYLHSLGIVHSDLKGANVLLQSAPASRANPRGCVCKLADFGLSRVLGANRTHVSTNTHGTVAYQAMEVLQEGRVTRASDVYSFAMVMLELITGERVFDGFTSSQILFQVFSGARPHMPEGLPAGYARLITDCWARDPAARPSFPAVHARLAALHAQLVACPRQQGSPGGGARAPADP